MYLKGGSQEDGLPLTLLSVVHSDKARRNRHGLKHREVLAGEVKASLMVTEHWKRLPREAVEAPSLGIFKSSLYTILGDMLQGNKLEQRSWTSLSPEVLSSLRSKEKNMIEISQLQYQ